MILYDCDFSNEGSIYQISLKTSSVLNKFNTFYNIIVNRIAVYKVLQLFNGTIKKTHFVKLFHCYEHRLRNFTTQDKIMTKKIILLSYAILLAFSLQGQNKLDFWRQQRKGANGDGGAILTSGTNPDAWFKAAAQAGIEFVRLNPVDWQGTGKDFLVGNADHFTTIPAKDLAYLLKVLNIAHKYQVKILLTMFVLPGARNAYRKHDYRLWSGKEYQQQAQQFWVQLAQALKNHPAIVGYNLLNEPHPARKYQLYEAPLHQFETWLKKIKNTTEDLNRFNRLMVKAIRKVDTQTPIVLNGWMHAAPEGMPYLEPINDPAILYAFHFYGPWAYSNYKTNKGRYSYPHHMPHTAGKTRNNFV